MRDILFRAWDKQSKQMINGVTVYHPADHIGIGSHEAPDYLNNDADMKQSNVEYGDDWIYIMSDFVLEQFTGLLDRNGVKIFENDVIYLAGYGNYVVEFPFMQLYDSSFEGDVGGILGNIHTHPELLEAK